jgi:signal peptidase II
VTGSESRGRLLPVVLGVAGVVLVVDVVTKVLAVAQLSGRPPVVVIPHVLWFDLVRNPGAAFSIGTGTTLLFTAIAAIVVIVILRTAGRLGSRGWAVALGAMLGGALGNLTDRVLRSPGVFRGHVIDFLELPHWPVFNIADSCVVGAAALMVLLSFRGIEMGGGHSRDAPIAAEPVER